MFPRLIMANELDRQRGELENEKIEIVSGSFKILIKGEDVKRMEDYYAESENKELIIFNNMFAVTPKEKFRARIMFNPLNKRILEFHLIYCGGYDIRCSVGINGEEEVKDKFLIVSKGLKNFILTAEQMTLNLTIKAERMNKRGSYVETQISSKDKELLSPCLDVYQIICFDENGTEQKLSCPKYIVAKCSECLERHFENALNADKPLVIKDFLAKTVKDFFFCLENQVLNYSSVTLDLAKMAHLYHVPSLFQVCENFLAETVNMINEWDNVETWIQFANTYNSVKLTSLISYWAEERIKKNRSIPKNWKTIVTNNQNFAHMVGEVRLGLYKSSPPTRYLVEESKSIYLICHDLWD